MSSPSEQPGGGASVGTEPAASVGFTVSVVVATFNRLDSLAGLLAGLALQSSPPDQVIVVDDGSEPPVNPISFPNAAYQLTLIRQANLGAGAARDAGVRFATSDVIIFVDDDMTVGPQFVEAHLREHQRGFSVVQAPFRNVLRPRTPLFELFTIRQHEQYFENCKRSTDALDPARLTTGNVSFRRSLYVQVGGFDLSLRRCEDRDLGLRFAGGGARLGFAADAVAEHDEPPEPIDRWLRVAREYGAAELHIARRHPDLLDPWSIYHRLPLAVRASVGLGTFSPRATYLLAALCLATARALARCRAREFAIRLYGMTYALAWFDGLITAFPARRDARRSLRRRAYRASEDLRVNFGGVHVDVLTLEDAVSRIVQLARERRGIVVTPNVDHLMLYRKDPIFASVYDRADLALADGMPLVMVARLLRLPLRVKVSGSDFTGPLLTAAASAGLRVFFFGSSEETRQAAASVLNRARPDLMIVGGASPWYEPGGCDSEMHEAVDQLVAAAPNLVLVALGAPKQERFIAEFGSRLPPACYVCCGASLDFIGGSVTRAPAWMSRSGLEWTYRLAKEPGRLWWRYLIQDMAFVPLVVRMTAHRMRGRKLVTSRPPSPAQAHRGHTIDSVTD